MLHHAQPTQHFISWHWQLLGQSWTNIQCQCTGKIALSVQSGPWPVSSGTASCVGSDRGSLSIKPFHAPPAPSAPSPCYPRQLPVTDHPPGSHQQTPGSRRTQEHYSTPEAHHSPSAPSNTGSTQESTLGLRLSLASLCPFKMGVVWFLQPLGDREEDLVGYMEGPGIEQNNAVLGQTEPHNHPAPQAAPSAHTPSSRAIATLTEPATHLADSWSRQRDWNYQRSPYKLYCTLGPPGWVIQTIALFTAL